MIASYQSIQIPRHIAMSTRASIIPLVIYLEWIGDFLSTWSDVYGANQ